MYVYDIASEAKEPKVTVDIPGQVVLALWGTEDGTFLAYLAIDKESGMHAHQELLDMDERRGKDTVQARLCVYHTGFSATWGSPILVEEVEVVKEDGGSRALNWQGMACIDGKNLAVREKAHKVSVRSVESFNLSTKHDFDHLSDAVSGLALWGPPEKKLLAMIHDDEIRVLALETEALLHTFYINNVWAAWSRLDGRVLRVCTSEGVEEHSLERLFDVGPSCQLFEEYANDRRLTDAQLESRICTDLSLFADRHGWLARDAAFLKLLLDRGLHVAMARFLSVHPSGVQSPLRIKQEDNPEVETFTSLLEAALEMKAEDKPELSLHIMLKAVLAVLERSTLPMGCMEVVSRFMEEALSKDRPEKVQFVLFEFLSAVKLIDLGVEHLPHSSERLCCIHGQVNPLQLEHEQKSSWLSRCFRMSAVLDDEKQDPTIWDGVEDDVYSSETLACIVPIPLPEDPAVQRSLITNPISFKSEVVVCLVEALWNDKFRAWFRWQAFLFLCLTVSYTWFCLTCSATGVARSKDTSNSALIGFVMGIISVLLNVFFLSYETLQVMVSLSQCIAAAKEEGKKGFAVKVAALVTTLREFYSSLWNGLASVCFVLVPASFVVYLLEADVVIIRATAAIGVLTIWLYTLYFARGWDHWAILVSMLVEILRDMFGFMLVMVVLVVAHASSLNVIHAGTRGEAGGEFETFDKALQSTVHMSFLGAWTSDEFVSAESEGLTRISWIMFYVLQFMIVLVSLNALIGIMGTTQGRVLDDADTMIQKQRVSIILDVMDIEDYIRRTTCFSWLFRSRKVAEEGSHTPFRERRWIHVLKPKESNEEEDGPPGSGALARVEDGLENGGDDKGNGIDSDQLLEFAEKIPNIEMLLSKVIQGTERLTPILNLAKKSWILSSQLDSAHANHDKESMDVLRDLATKAHHEKLNLQAELKRAREEAEALERDKAALLAARRMLEERVSTLEAEGKAHQTRITEQEARIASVDSELAAAKNQLEQATADKAALQQSVAEIQAQASKEHDGQEQPAPAPTSKGGAEVARLDQLMGQMQVVLAILQSQPSRVLSNPPSPEQEKRAREKEKERERVQHLIDTSPYSQPAVTRRSSQTGSAAVSGPLRAVSSSVTDGLASTRVGGAVSVSLAGTLSQSHPASNTAVGSRPTSMQ